MGYPKRFRLDHGIVTVEFTALTVGTVVHSNSKIPLHKAGVCSSDWIPHTDTDRWTPVESIKSILHNSIKDFKW